MKKKSRIRPNKKMFVYLNHMDGEFYIRDVCLTKRDLYCEKCKQYDYLIFEGTKKQILDNLRENIRYRIARYRDKKNCIPLVEYDLLLHEMKMYKMVKDEFLLYEKRGF